MKCINKITIMRTRITLGKIYLRIIEDSLESRIFVKSLFLEPDIKKYYILCDDHSKNIDLFVTFLSQQNQNKRALNYIVESEDYLPIGLLTAELQQDDSGNVMWNVAYAILSKYRRKGYAYEALLGLVEVLKNFRIDLISLDISESNTASSNLAKKCKFKPMISETGGRVGYIDPEHEELGFRLKWMKNIKENKSKRDELNLLAIQEFRSKNYNQAIGLFLQSLREPFFENSPYSDGQIYSNLGMAYSSTKQYPKAYECLTKAFILGIRNDSVIKELQWLKNNVGLG